MQAKNQEYIHYNAVKDLIVENVWDYMYGSARNYADLDGLLEACAEPCRSIKVLGPKPMIENVIYK
jgi:hypothetical protein